MKPRPRGMVTVKPYTMICETELSEFLFYMVGGFSDGLFFF